MAVFNLQIIVHVLKCYQPRNCNALCDIAGNTYVELQVTCLVTPNLRGATGMHCAKFSFFSTKLKFINI